MSITATHTFTDADGNGVTLHLRNTLWNQARHGVIKAMGQPNGDTPDHDERGYFAYIVAYVDTAEGIALNPDAIETPETFNTQYRTFMRVVDADTIVGCMKAINALIIPNGDVVTKPDGTLTDEERADPKSKPPAKSTKGE